MKILGVTSNLFAAKCILNCLNKPTEAGFVLRDNKIKVATRPFFFLKYNQKFNNEV